MFKRFAFVLLFSLAFVSAAQARDKHLAGTVTRVDSGTLEIKTDTGESVSVALKAQTTYMKWIMSKPWQQDPRADLRMLKVGSRVHIDVSKDDPNTAKTVWIVVGRVGQG